MSEEKKELKKSIKNEELCEGKQKLSIDELEQVTGGADIRCKSMATIGGDYEEDQY